ncbi:MAG: hypothetical protein ACRCYO_08020 [Bacteroidia bacterium]
MLKLTTTAAITPIEEFKCTATPRLFVDDIKLIFTSAKSNQEWQLEHSSAIGSNFDWLNLNGTDSFCFNSETRLLQSLMFSYSENNAEPWSHDDDILSAEKIIGIPKLSDDTAHFEISPFLYRHYNIEKNLFICFNDLLDKQKKLTELKISNDISLYFQDNFYWAWGLHNPEQFLSDSFSSAPINSTSIFIKYCLKESLDLITIENVTKMDNKNSFILFQIQQLCQKMVHHEDFLKYKSLSILYNWLLSLIDKFYPDYSLSDTFK